MDKLPHRRTYWLFGSLALYIALQFAWWAYLLVEKDRELEALITAFDLRPRYPGVPDVHASRTLWMVVGEGSVFVLLLLLALYVTFRSVRHELRLARAQRNFLLAVSHELRTPIAAVKLNLQTAVRSGLDELQREQLLGSSLEGVRRLDALTEKILLATRLEEHGVPLDPAPMDLSRSVAEAVNAARMTYGREHQFKVRTPGMIPAECDAHALRSILDNLLENACKYSPAGSTIEVDLSTQDGQALLAVSDEGSGVPEDERERIFALFHRSGGEETRQARGTGLGLYIVAQLLRQMGGGVRVRPRAARGSTFAATFPLHS